MEEKPGEFVFIILKPAAAKDKNLTKFIYTILNKYGQIKYIREFITVDKKKILQHYQASKSSFWYPFITNYFAHKRVHILILEAKSGAGYYDSDGKHCSFAKFLKQQIIGPADICKTKKHHIRRQARRKISFLVDNLIHSSDNNEEALAEIRLWYQDEPQVIAEFERKA